jgi:multiple sugar transport system substrate-binding protein
MTRRPTGANASGLSRRRFLAGATAAGATAVAVPGLAGCAGSPGGQSIEGQPVDSELYPLDEARRLDRSLNWPRSIGDPARRTKIVVAHTWTPDFWVRQMQFDTFFMERHPTIEVATENTPGGDYLSKYVIQAASGSLPDIMYAQYGFAQSFIQAGKFAALDAYVARQPDFDEADFTRPALDYYRSGGSLHGLGYDCGPVMLAYNKDIFDDGGVPYPNEDWTLNDLRDAARRLTQGSGADRIYGFSSFPDLSFPYASPLFLQPFGGRVLDQEQTHCVVTSARAREAARWWVDALMPATPTLGEHQALNITGAFLQGRAAMDIAGSWLGPMLRGQDAFQYDFSHWPAGPVRRSTSAVGSCYGITSGSQHQDAAWVYLNEYMSTAGLTFMFASTGSGSPGRKSAWPAYLRSPNAPNGARLFYDALDSYATADGVLHLPSAPKIKDTIKPIWDRVRDGRTDVADAMGQIRDGVDPILLGDR